MPTDNNEILPIQGALPADLRWVAGLTAEGTVPGTGVGAIFGPGRKVRFLEFQAEPAPGVLLHGKFSIDGLVLYNGTAGMFVPLNDLANLALKLVPELNQPLVEISADAAKKDGKSEV